MVTVSDFAQFLLAKGPERDVSRQSLYNFLKYFCPLHQELNQRLIENYFSFCLQFNFWRARKELLFKPVISDLKEFTDNSFHSLDKKQLTDLNSYQVIEIESHNELQKIISHSLLQRHEFQNFKFHQSQPGKLYALGLKQNGEFLVEAYSSFVSISQGKLVPLLPLTRLHYNKFMELKHGRQQLLEVSPMLIARFQRNKNEDQGIYIKNYNLKFDGQFKGSLDLQPQLFQSLKNVENHFIDLSTDPEYVSITSDLKDAITSVQKNSGQGLIKAQMALEKARFSLKRLFPNDKGIIYLISELENAMLAEDTCLKTRILETPQA